MATNVPNVSVVTLQKFVDALIASVKFNDGSSPDPAPDAFKSRLGQELKADDSGEVLAYLRINPDGRTASVHVQVSGSKTLSIAGDCDIGILATKLV